LASFSHLVWASSGGLPLAPSRFANINVGVLIAHNTREETPGLLSNARTTAGAANAIVLAPPPECVVTSERSNLLARFEGCMNSLVVLPANVCPLTPHSIVDANLERAGPTVALPCRPSRTSGFA